MSSNISPPPALNLTVFPPTTYLTVKPGTTITHRVILKYDGTSRVEVVPELVDFTTDGLTGTPVLQQPSKLDYVKFQNSDKKLGSSFVIEPGDQVELILNISPPLHAKLGEQPLALVLTAVPDTQVVFTGGSAQTAGAVASNVILSVQNDFDNQAELRLNQIKLPKIVDSFSSIKFEVLAENVGRNAGAMAGEIRLSHGWSGKELKHWFIYPDVTLAHSTRLLRASFQDPAELEPTSEVQLAPLEYKPPFLIGPYEVTVELATSSQGQASVHQRTQAIFALPFSIIGLLILGVSLYALIIKRIKTDP